MRAFAAFLVVSVFFNLSPGAYAQNGETKRAVFLTRCTPDDAVETIAVPIRSRLEEAGWSMSLDTELPCPPAFDTWTDLSASTEAPQPDLFFWVESDRNGMLTLAVPNTAPSEWIVRTTGDPDDASRPITIAVIVSSTAKALGAEDTAAEAPAFAPLEQEIHSSDAGNDVISLKAGTLAFKIDPPAPSPSRVDRMRRYFTNASMDVSYSGSIVSRTSPELHVVHGISLFGDIVLFRHLQIAAAYTFSFLSSTQVNDAGGERSYAVARHPIWARFGAYLPIARFVIIPSVGIVIDHVQIQTDYADSAVRMITSDVNISLLLMVSVRFKVWRMLYITAAAGGDVLSSDAKWQAVDRESENVEWITPLRVRPFWLVGFGASVF